MLKIFRKKYNKEITQLKQSIVNLNEEVNLQRERAEQAIGHLNERKRQLADEKARAERAIGYLNERKRQLADEKARAERAIGYLNERKKQVKSLSARNEILKSMERAADRGIEEAKIKLWGGYQQEGIHELIEFGSKSYIDNSRRAIALYELARFFSDKENHYTALRYMSDCRSQSIDFMRKLRPRLLELDLLLKVGDRDRSLNLIEEYISRNKNNPNYLIAKSNYFQRSNEYSKAASSLNEIFNKNGMASIAIQDINNPFLTIKCAEPLNLVQDDHKVSVLMSNYNSAPYLELAIRSMLEQTWQNIELIITDDCSTDDSRQIIERIATEDPRVVYIPNDKNLGTYGNRNKMLNICTGDYVTVHDSDDWSHPQMIEHQMRHLQDNPDVRVNTTLMCRTTLDLQFGLRPSRVSLEYCHMNYPGFLMRTTDVRELGGWDPIMANADAELERRAKLAFGKDAFVIINPDCIYSFFLVHDQSLTQQKLMNLRSLTFGSRNEYHCQSKYWLKQKEEEGLDPETIVKQLSLAGRTSKINPFPSPNALLPPHLKKTVLEYDVLLVSDLFLLGGTRSCNVNYLKVLNSLGKKVAVFNWPRGDLKQFQDINTVYRQLAADGVIEIVTWEDKIKAKDVILHHPPIANILLDNFPEVETEKVCILVNQLPFQTTEREKYFYNPPKVETNIRHLFKVDDIEWIPISPLTRRYIDEFSAEITISHETWYPPLADVGNLIPLDDRFARIVSRKPKFVRHTRDHWTKWPMSQTRLNNMYMVNDGIDFSVLGGAKAVRNVLKYTPDSWTIHSFDSVNMADFLNSADIYLNFNNEIYIEEFGRNIMEAMAYGIPVITEPSFSESFGDAVLSAPSEGPKELVDALRSDKAFFEHQIYKGLSFVEDNCSFTAVKSRLEKHFNE
nr:glycosyltransferase [uncultured Cohaesibacter sp.]